MSEQDPTWPADGSGADGSGAGGTGADRPGDDAAAGDTRASSPPPPPPSSTPPPPPSPQTSGDGGFGAPQGAGAAGASLGVRFGARLIDGILLGIVGAVLGGALGLGTPGVTGTSFVLTVISVVLGFAYYVGLETTQGATFGKQLLNLRVVGDGGGHPSPEESFKRNIFYALQLVPILGGIAGLVAVIAVAITISSSDDNRGWHDEFAGTLVHRT